MLGQVSPVRVFPVEKKTVVEVERTVWSDCEPVTVNRETSSHPEHGVAANGVGHVNRWTQLVDPAEIVHPSAPAFHVEVSDDVAPGVWLLTPRVMMSPTRMMNRRTIPAMLRFWSLRSSTRASSFPEASLPD